MLNKYFEAAVRRYKEKFDNESLISPISEGDAKIIREIIELFKKLKQDAVVQILKNWKFHKDLEVEEALLGVNTNLVRESVESKENLSDEEFQERIKFIEEQIRNKLEEEIQKRPFINFRGKDFNVWNVWSVDMGSDIQDSVEKFYICINKIDETVQKVPVLANTYFWFYDEEVRDKELKTLKNLLEKSKTLKYVK
jgi:hypothetical protein